jgi:hypothetical protein
LYHSINPVAGYAVNGNTDGYFLNKSTTHTNSTIGTPEMVPVFLLKDKPLEIAGEIE